jgi:tRNA pseudouridine32 synthase/23S rRNA pseudouridine746 synthase
MDDKLHRFSHDVSGVELPARFTFPFHYVPHELCKVAAREVMDYALNQDQWHDELLAGKMLGVLVVKDDDSALGFLAAYSGNLAHNGNNPYFVPHIYNLLEPQGLFRTGEAQITEINHRIESLENSQERTSLKELLDKTLAQQEREELEMRQTMNAAKTLRDKCRNEGNITAEQEAQMIKESQFQKAELKRLKKRHSMEIDSINQRLNEQLGAINNLKAKRRAMSEKLQRQLFELFVVHNARGESMDVATIFERRLHRLPPGGTGECCAPKLLQYAFLHGYKPVCMAEFWVGESPQGEVRHHGHYYPACRSKCLPLLEFMLQGLDVESNPLATKPSDDTLKIIYEDQWLIVIDKPAGMLTVPGKDEETSSALQIVQSMLREDSLNAVHTAQYSNNTQVRTALEVHRIDQATSGLVVFAKTQGIQSALRKQFEERTVSKIYLALLDGVLTKNEGTIDLPLRPDIDDRPRQVVDIENGKKAITKYRVLEQRGTHTIVEFMPLTGRTHQLRVHASHPQGLNCPITGDMLYGTASHRLCLHAWKLNFTHPITGEPMHFSSEMSFL